MNTLPRLDLPIPRRTVRPVSVLLTVLAIAGIGTACASSRVATHKSSVTGAPSDIGSAAIGTWVCSTTPSSSSVTAKINSDGSFVLNAASSPANHGKWTVDQKGVHAQVDLADLGLVVRVDVVNPALATANWPTVSRATMDLQFPALHQSTSQTLSIHLSGLNGVTFQASPIGPGGRSSPWTCHRE